MNYPPRALLLTLACCLALLACQGDDLAGDRLEMLPQRLEIPAGLNPVLSHNFVVGDDIPTEHDRFAAETGVAWDDWSRVTPRRASLFITEPGLDWSFAQEVVLKGYRDDPAVQVELFYRDQIRSDAGQRLDMIPVEVDLRDLLDGEEYGLVLELRFLRRSPPQSFPVQLEYNWSGIRAD